LAYYVGGREKRHGVQLLYFKKSHINWLIYLWRSGREGYISRS
jgi:hypothetical protein